MQSLLYTFLDLGDAVSRNLDFAHENDGKVSYGEETITETNLLEILRKHGDRGTSLTTVSKGKEAKIGADWEWVIVGQKYSFYMRVQAKRTKKNNKLSVVHKVKSSGLPQIDVLIDNAKAKLPGDIDWCPAYCFYSKNSERKQWAAMPSSPKLRFFEYGCLIAEANQVKKKGKISKIEDIEDISVPWHWFFCSLRRPYTYAVEERDTKDDTVSFLKFSALSTRLSSSESGRKLSSLRFPTADQLNGYDDIEDDFVGLRLTDKQEVELQRLRSRRDVIDPPRFMVLDVTAEPRRRD